jgi:hypothetical protein
VPAMLHLTAVSHPGLRSALRCCVPVLLAITFSLASEVAMADGLPSPARICRWHGGKKAALSLRFDDSDPSHIEQAVPMLNERDLIGTFLVNPGNEDYLKYRSVWEGPVLQRGHELGDHTMNHTGADTDAEAEQQIGEAAELLHRLQPNLKLLVFGPGGGTRWFPRKSFAFFETKYGLVSAGDAASGWAMSCTESYTSWSVARFAADLEQAIAQGVWFRPYFHELRERPGSLSMRPDTFRQVLEAVQAHRADLWQAGMSAIHQYERERLESRLWVHAVGADALSLSLTCATDEDLYTQPLTIEVNFPADAGTATVTAETGTAMPARVEQSDGHRVLRFEVAPVDMTYTVSARGVGGQGKTGELKAPGPHPYLLFTAAEAPAILGKTSDPLAKTVWEAILRAADSYVSEEGSAAEKDLVMWDWSRRIEVLGLAYAVTHNEAYGRVGATFLTTAARDESWRAGNDEMRVTGEVMGTLGLGYDWLYDALTTEQRAEVRDILVRYGLEPFTRVVAAGDFWTDWYRGNWGAVIDSNAGLAALALLGEEPRAADWARLCERKLWRYTMAIAEDGGWGESISYGAYAWSNGVKFLRALRRVTGDDLFENPRLRRLPYWFINMLDTDRQNYIPFSNCGLGVRATPEVLTLLAGEYKDAPVQSVAKELLSGRERPAVFAFLWYDPTVAAAPLSTLPLTQVWPDLGWATMRSSWDDPKAVLFGLKGGQQDWDHLHHDLNGFVLYAYGKPLIAELWYPMTVWACETEAHNTIMVAGKEQYGKVGIMGQGSGPDSYHRGMVGDAVDTPWYTRLVGDASLAYDPGDVRSFVREAMYLRHTDPADPADYFVMFDDVAATRPVPMDWMLHTYGRITASGHTFAITQDDAAVDVTMLAPEEFAVENHEKSLEEIRAPEPFDSAVTFAYLKLRPAQPADHEQFLSVLTPHPASAPSAARVTPIRLPGVLGAVVESGETQDVALFALDGPKMAASGVEAVGRSCFVRRSGGRVTAAALQRGQRMVVDGVLLFENGGIGHTALRFTETAVAGKMDLYDGVPVRIRVPRRPTKVLIDGEEHEFQYDPEGQCVTFLEYYPDGPRAKRAAGTLREVQVVLE